MNRYKIIFPYQSSLIHLAENDTKAFDKCFTEINESNRNPDVFVVLNLDTNVPYYLEINKSIDKKLDNPIDNPIDTEGVINKDVREKSDTPSNVPQDSFGTSKIENFNSTVKASADQFNPISNPISNSDINIQKTDLLEKRIDHLENEMIKMKMKVEYVSQTTGIANMNNTNNINNNTNNNVQDQDSECSIQ